MRPSVIRLSAALALSASLATPAIAGTYNLDPAHTDVLFTVQHLGISEVTGRFQAFDGSFEFDSATKTLKGMKAEIQAASVTTANEKRDGHLKSDDFFNVEAFPVIRFASTGVEPAGTGRFRVTGDLTIRNKTLPVTLDVTFKGTVKDPWGNDRAAFVATGTINRQDFGVRWSKALDSGGFVASDEVDIRIAAQGILQGAGVPGAR